MRNPSLLSDEALRYIALKENLDKIERDMLASTLRYMAWLVTGQRVRTTDAAIKAIRAWRGA